MNSQTPDGASRAFWGRVALHALWLHGGWEVVQCRRFYDMSGASPASTFRFMVGATAGDVVLTLLLIALTLRAVQFQHRAATGRLLGTLALSGTVTATLLELLAHALGWWRYSPLMPRVQFFGGTVGLLPVLQLALVPSLAFFLARPFLNLR